MWVYSWAMGSRAQGPGSECRQRSPLEALLSASPTVPLKVEPGLHAARSIMTMRGAVGLLATAHTRT